MSWIVKLGKKGKKIVKKIITPAEKHYVGYTRRIERVKTGERICAMTFDDGPMGLPASPDRFEGKTLTDALLDTLAQYGAKGSFGIGIDHDIIRASIDALESAMNRSLIEE